MDEYKEEIFLLCLTDCLLGCNNIDILTNMREGQDNLYLVRKRHGKETKYGYLYLQNYYYIGQISQFIEEISFKIEWFENNNLLIDNLSNLNTKSIPFSKSLLNDFIRHIQIVLIQTENCKNKDPIILDLIFYTFLYIGIFLKFLKRFFIRR